MGDGSGICDRGEATGDWREASATGAGCPPHSVNKRGGGGSCGQGFAEVLEASARRNSSQLPGADVGGGGGDTL